MLDPQTARPRARPTPWAMRRTAARCALSGPARERGERGRPLRLCRGGGGPSYLGYQPPYLFSYLWAPPPTSSAAPQGPLPSACNTSWRRGPPPGPTFTRTTCTRSGAAACTMRRFSGRARREAGELGRAAGALGPTKRPRGGVQSSSVSAHAVCGHCALASISQTWIHIPSRWGPSHPRGDHPCVDPQVARPLARPTPRAVRRTAEGCGLVRASAVVMPCAAIARWRRSVRRGSTSHPVGEHPIPRGPPLL